ncbi:MAG TPA: ATP synthase subunit I [Gemmatimonadaceae bacterium]|nr:ATP synthase subunit I [Vicinamibacterales bacterium]
MLQRIQLTALVICAAMAVLALLAGRNGGALALGVLGGGAIAMISFVGIRGGVERLAAGADAAGARPRIGGLLLRLVGRYALLALLAYVMIARLRLPPLGLLAGASSVVAAAVVEAGRFLLKK